MFFNGTLDKLFEGYANEQRNNQIQMFERFYRVDLSRSKNTGGMGIGLAITKAIMEAHGGQISAYGAPGVGTTVTMSSPNDMAFNL